MNPATELDEPLRVSLIERLQEATNLQSIDSTAWSSLWLAELSALESLVHKAEAGDPSVTLSLRSQDITRAAKAWAARTRETQDTRSKKRTAEDAFDPTSRISRPISRSESAKKTVLERDKESCIISKAGIPIEVAPIYCYSMGKNEQSDQQQGFWATLALFWGPEKVKEWREAVLGPQGTEVPSNLLCLMTLVHTLWGKSCFALKPLQVADDGKSMQVQFCWLRPATYRSQVPITEKPCLPRNLDCGPHNIKLWNCLTEKKICSGEIIEIRTDDPELRPLPSAVLLQMQWILHRVLAMSGAADAPDEELDTDSESDVASWEADEIEDLPPPHIPRTGENIPAATEFVYVKSP